MNNRPTRTRAARAAGPPPTGRGSMEWTWPKVNLLVALCCLALLDGANGAMSSTLRPYLMGSFAATPDQITWTAILYFAAKLYALLLAARVQERFGQRPALLGACSGLLLATVGSGFVASYPAILLVRIFQGASGGLVLALGQGALLGAFARRDQPLVQGLFALAVVMFPATIVPAFLGGYAYLSDWRYAYAWMGLVGFIGWAMLFYNRKALDTLTLSGPVPWGRIALLLTALFAGVYVLQQGERHAWLESRFIVWPALAALACALGLLWVESSRKPTYLRYHCFGFGDFTFGLSVSLLAGVALFGSGFVIPGFAAGILQFPVWQTGLAQLSAAGLVTLSLLSVALALRFTKVPLFLFVVLGLCLFATAMWRLGQAPSDINFAGLIPWLALRGLAVGCLFLPLTVQTLTCVPRGDFVAAAGLFNGGRQLGALAGVAWMQTLLEHLSARNQTVLGEALSQLSPNVAFYSQSVQRGLAAYGTPLAQAPASATALMLQEAHRQMSCVAFNGCFQSLAMLFLFSFPLVLLAHVLTKRFLKPAAS